MPQQLLFLGTGAGTGVPSYHCGCRACREASEQPRLARGRSAVAILGTETVLIDAPPELRGQLVREGVGGLDRFLMTHWHFDHSGGVGDLEFFVRLARAGRPLPTHVTEPTREHLARAFWYLLDCLDVEIVVPGAEVTSGELTLTAVAAAHEAGTVGWLIRTPRGTTGYLPDTGPLPDDTRERLAGVDTLVLGATFWGRNWMPETHLALDEAVDEALGLGVGRAYFTHLAMHYDTPVSCPELEEYLRGRGSHLHLAYDGTRLEI